MSDFYVFGVVDGAGEMQRDVCVCSSENIIIEGVFPCGESFCYEGQASDLAPWAKIHCMKAFKHGHEFDQLPEPKVDD